jgi:hypothetical protein
MQSKKSKNPEKPASEKPTSRLKNVKAGDDRWWDFIERSRKDAEDLDEQSQNLLELLTDELSAEEILEFDNFVQERLRDAFRGDLWGIAYLMNGGCSDDGFDYFCGWLVAKGRKHYEAALDNPENAAKGVDPEGEPFECEDLWYVASRAWQAKTGKELADYEKVATNVQRSLKGELFDEETIYDDYPKIAKKFGGGG